MNDLKTNTEKLASLFNRLGITKFYLTGAGNSLMSGYSRLFKTVPLFKRNQSLSAVFNKKYIDIDEKAIDVKLTNKTNEDGTIGAPALYANIPIVTIKNEARNTRKTI